MTDFVACVSCARGFYEECGHTPPILPPQALSDERNGNRKADSDIGTSAGRKRAAAAYQIDKGEACEWRGLTNCGGGLHPIIGCINGLQVHRHHGPIKNTSHNESGNIHLICVRCHNIWHAKNDPYYIEEAYAVLPHKPEIIEDKYYQIVMKGK